jgi:hypothetical protein
MIGFKLAYRLIDCPIYWQNFILSFPQTGRDIAIPVLNRELKKYGARYRLGNQSVSEHIEFSDEQHLTLFVLRYS